MNASPEKELCNRNPWEQRAEFSPVGSRNITLSLAIVFLCALAVPLAAFYETVALLILAALFFYVVSAARAPSTVALLLGTAFLTVSVAETLAAGAVILALIVGTGALAFLLTASESPWIPLLLPVAASCVSYAVLGSWKIALFALAFLPAAILLALATRRGEIRSRAVCFATVGLLAVVAVTVGYFLSTQSAARGISVPNFVSLLEDAFGKAVLDMRDEYEAVLREAGLAEESVNAFLEPYSDERLLTLTETLASLFPAICCIVCGVIAFEGQILLNGIYRGIGWKQVLTPRSMLFTMSLPAAILYFATFLFSLFPMGSSMAALVISNLNMILFPGFLVIGVTMLRLTVGRAKSGGRTVWILLIGAVLCCTQGSAISLLSLFGANSVVLGAMYQKMKNQSGE